MAQALEYEDKVDNYLERLTLLAEKPAVSQTIPMQQNQQGTYVPQNNNQSLQSYNFGEQILDMKSSTSVVGEAIGAGLAGTVYGLIGGFLPGMAAMSPGLITAAAGFGIGRYLLKSGFTHSIARGIMLAGITTFIAPMVGSIAGRFSGGGSGTGIPTGAAQ